MGIEYVTLVICDRCKTESHHPRNDSEWWERYATTFPAQVSSYSPQELAGLRDTRRHVKPGGVVCLDCLTDDERAQHAECLDRDRREREAFARDEGYARYDEDIPF